MVGYIISGHRVLYGRDSQVLVFEHWNYYSMLLLKVRKVKRSGTDYCLSVPLSIKNLARSTLNCTNCGELLLRVIYQLILVTVLGQRVTPEIW